MSPKSV